MRNTLAALAFVLLLPPSHSMAQEMPPLSTGDPRHLWTVGQHEAQPDQIPRTGGAPDAGFLYRSPGQHPSASLIPLAPLLPSRLSRVEVQDPGEPRSFARVGAGTLVGGVAGGLLGGLVTFVAAGGNSSGEAGEVDLAVGLIGAAVGYPLGAAFGAREAAAVSGRRPPLGTVLAASVLSAAAGGLLWYQVENQHFADDSGVAPMLALTAVVHLGVTSYVARRSATRTER